MPALPTAMTRKSGQKCLEENKDEQAISEAALNKIIGSAGVYDLEVKCEIVHIFLVLPLQNRFLILSMNRLGVGAPRYPYVYPKAIPEGSSVLDVTARETNICCRECHKNS